MSSQKKKMWTILLHLGSNMWGKPGYKPKYEPLDTNYHETMYCDKSTWKVPILTCFEWNVFTDGSASKPYILDSADDLKAFNEVAATDGYKAKNYRLAADITLNGTEGTSNWTPIAEFTGCLDGKGYTISGIHVVATSNYAGMFAKVTGATIRNLRIRLQEHLMEISIQLKVYIWKLRICGRNQ